MTELRMNEILKGVACSHILRYRGNGTRTIMRAITGRNDDIPIEQQSV